MKAVVLLYDTLCRNFLSPYGCQWTYTPNFDRLARRALTYDRSYVCSMPCMPARRDMHTGRPSFLHRSWSPLEPFDDSVPEMLKKAGIHTHLVTDHLHYFEEGGANYHTKFSTWDGIRGQEGDPWIPFIGEVAPEPGALNRNADNTNPHSRQDRINRRHMREVGTHYQERTFASGLRFLRENAGKDNWMLQIESFDPHEPFFTPRRYQDLFAAHFDAFKEKKGGFWDWPWYGRSNDIPEDEIEHLRYQYAALIAMCDAHLGDVLDTFDELDLWKDTMLAVCTDHGFLLGEHESLGKNLFPLWEEISHTPFFLWDPRSRGAGGRREALVQPTIDLPVTLLNLFGQEPTRDMLGKDLASTATDDVPVRDYAIFGYHGSHVQITDGRHVYFRPPATDAPGSLCEYTFMPAHIWSAFSVGELSRDVTLSEPFSFTKGLRPLRIPIHKGNLADAKPALFDVSEDPGQIRPLDDPQTEARMVAAMSDLMRECDAPPEQWTRLGI